MLRRGELEGRLDPSYNLAIRGNWIVSRYQFARMSELVQMLGGGTPSKSNPEFWKGSISWASPKDFGSFYLTETEDHITEIAITESSTQLIPKGSVLIVFRSGILIHSLPVAVTMKDMAINQDLKALIPKSQVQAEYLAIFFQVYAQRLLKLITKHSTTVQSINTEQFTRLLIPVPPKEIQHQIIKHYLDTLEIKHKKEAEARVLLESIDGYVLSELGITLPEERRETVFYVPFSRLRGGRFDPSAYHPKRKQILDNLAAHYPLLPLKRVAMFRKVLLSSNAENLPYMGLENIESNTGRFVPSSEEKTSFGTALQFQKGDILFPKLRPYLNKVHLAESDGVCSTEFHVLHSHKILNSFLHCFLTSKAIVRQTSLLMTGNTLPRLQTNDIINLLVPLPPLDVQERIAREAQARRERAKALEREAAELLQAAKAEVERMILG